MRYGATHRGFESLPLRHSLCVLPRIRRVVGAADLFRARSANRPAAEAAIGHIAGAPVDTLHCLQVPCARAAPVIECPGQGRTWRHVMKSGFRGVLSAAGIIGLCLVALVAVPVSAAPTAFGAKLTTSTQPQGAMTCHGLDPDRIPVGGVCTWVAAVAFENGSHFKAPKTGTLHHL